MWRDVGEDVTLGAKDAGPLCKAASNSAAQGRRHGSTFWLTEGWKKSGLFQSLSFAVIPQHESVFFYFEWIRLIDMYERMPCLLRNQKENAAAVSQALRDVPHWNFLISQPWGSVESFPPWSPPCFLVFALIPFYSGFRWQGGARNMMSNL